MRLKDKVILVTGSTTGIGEAMVRLFAREGATVVIHGTREAAARAIADEIIGEKGRAFCALGSLEDPQAPERIIRAAIDQCGRIDGLVNNAALIGRGSLETTDVEHFDRIMAINLRAPLLMIKAALPHFRRQGGGRVLNIGSLNGYCGEKKQLAYSISKGGLMTLSRNLADAYGTEGIRVNHFNVGWTLTPNEYALKRKEGLPPDWPSKIPKAFAPSGAIMSPEDIAWAAVYFLSDEARLISGAVVDLEQFPVIGRNPVKESF
jgi:NAD(P)-dependent dehydrogenase (short-subunit alcohol dehydrogenase family)